MDNKTPGKIFVGTSGWSYKHWMGRFYPTGLKPKDFFPYYQKFFQTVELNSSFYHLPTAQTFENWRASTPEDFLFSVKASRYITHMKKLIQPKESFGNFIVNADALKEKLGPILFQLPPGWEYNEDRFKEFVEVLPKSGYRFTFEFRNKTWYNENVYEVLQKNNLAFCIYELEHHLSPIIATADFVYIRLHGPENKYAGDYNSETLYSWAMKCKKWQKEGKDVFVYFDNDQNAYAAYNAQTLLEMTQLATVESIS